MQPRIALPSRTEQDDLRGTFMIPRISVGRAKSAIRLCGRSYSTSLTVIGSGLACVRAPARRC